MNWLKSLLLHNKSWLLPIFGSAAYAAASSLKDGKIDTTAVGIAVLTTAATLVKSPVQAPKDATQAAVQSVVLATADNVANGAPLGSKTVTDAAGQVAKDAVLGSIANG
jgi:hypothetical protein